MEQVVDWQSIAIILLGVGFSAVGWFARQTWDAVKRLDADIKQIEVTMPTVYVNKSDYQLTTQRIERELRDIAQLHESQRTEDMKEIRHMFTRIHDKLENKADR